MTVIMLQIRVLFYMNNLQITAILLVVNYQELHVYHGTIHKISKRTHPRIICLQDLNTPFDLEILFNLHRLHLKGQGIPFDSQVLNLLRSFFTEKERAHIYHQGHHKQLTPKYKKVQQTVYLINNLLLFLFSYLSMELPT